MVATGLSTNPRQLIVVVVPSVLWIIYLFLIRQYFAIADMEKRESDGG